MGKGLRRFFHSDLDARNELIEKSVRYMLDESGYGFMDSTEMQEPEFIGLAGVKEYLNKDDENMLNHVTGIHQSIKDRAEIISSKRYPVLKKYKSFNRRMLGLVELIRDGSKLTRETYEEVKRLGWRLDGCMLETEDGGVISYYSARCEIHLHYHLLVHLDNELGNFFEKVVNEQEFDPNYYPNIRTW